MDMQHPFAGHATAHCTRSELDTNYEQAHDSAKCMPTAAIMQLMLHDPCSQGRSQAAIEGC